MKTIPQAQFKIGDKVISNHIMGEKHLGTIKDVIFRNDTWQYEISFINSVEIVKEDLLD